MTMELTRTFTTEQYTRALSAWQWIGLDGLEPWFTTAFGDVFLIGDDGIYWLDVAAGELSVPFSSPAEAKRVLGTEEGMDEYLLAGLAFAASEAGIEATGEQILAYKVPPVLEGEFEVDNLEVVRFEEALTRAGRLHDEIKDLPDGAEISGYDD
jgi:hypothetical protein